MSHHDHSFKKKRTNQIQSFRDCRLAFPFLLLFFSSSKTSKKDKNPCRNKRKARGVSQLKRYLEMLLADCQVLASQDDWVTLVWGAADVQQLLFTNYVIGNAGKLLYSLVGTRLLLNRSHFSSFLVEASSDLLSVVAHQPRDRCMPCPNLWNPSTSYLSFLYLVVQWRMLHLILAAPAVYQLWSVYYLKQY